jgi:hypothetical protein
VDAGNYRGNFKFTEKAVTIRSRAGPEGTTLAGKSPAPQPVVTINQGKLLGFTITGGWAYYGGGIRAYGTAEVGNCIVTGNRVIIYGDPYMDRFPVGSGGGIFADEEARITNCRIQRNFARLTGGGLAATGNTVIEQSAISRNRAGTSGAGLLIGEGSVTVRNCRITRNTIYLGQAGGLLIKQPPFGSATTATLTNTLIANNQAGNGGSGLVVSGGAQATLINCVIYGNLAESGQGERGLLRLTHNVQMLNTIIWGNRGELPRRTLAAITEYSNIQNLSPTLLNGNIDTDPLWVDPQRGDFHLQPGSPCIDAGHPGDAYRDLDGSRNDMGLYGGPWGEG